jgi:hypothetical protein
MMGLGGRSSAQLAGWRLGARVKRGGVTQPQHGCGTHASTPLSEFVAAHSWKGSVVARASDTYKKRRHNPKTVSQFTAGCSGAATQAT